MPRGSSCVPAPDILRPPYDLDAILRLPASDDEDRRVEGHTPVELLDVGDGHADAAVGCRGAERADVIGAVDALAVVEAHPTRLQRVIGRARRDGAARERARPRLLWDVPRRIDDLALDLVAAGARLESDPADRDGIGLAQPQVVIEAQLLARSVDADDPPIAMGELAQRDARPARDRGGRLDDAIGVRRGQLGADGRDERALAHCHAVTGRRAPQPTAGA